ncbi:MAG: S9 family peptidase [Myxococcaceae bacterium]|nr:S9 family peptidase [Myxococcaceae bacterium]
MNAPLRLRSRLLAAALLASSACATLPDEPAAAELTRGAPATAAPAPAPQPPVAERAPHPVTLHGDTRQDDYFWLREKQDPKVRAHLEAENAYTDAVMKGTEGLQTSLYEELLGRIQQTDLSVPYRLGAFEYYTRTQEGRQYPFYFRKPAAGGDEQLLLDLNALAEGHTYMGLGTFRVSDDGHLLAFSTDTNGFRQYALQVKDLRTGKLLPERVEKTVSVAWAADNRTLFYTVEDSAKRSYRLYRHVLGTPVEKDVLVYEEKDERFAVYVSRTRSGGYLLLNAGSHTTSEVHVLDARTPTRAFRVLAPRRQDHEYSVEHRGDSFYVLTNRSGRNFELAVAPVKRPGEANWKTKVAHREDVMLEDVLAFENHLVLLERESGLNQVSITDLRTGKVQRVPFDEQVYVVFPEENREFRTDRFRFSYTSPVTPRSVYEVGLSTLQRTLLKETPVLGGYDRSRYQTERMYAQAEDGVRIPVSLVYRKDLVRDGRAPALLRGYGSYGSPTYVGFSSNDVSLLDRGFVVATAHVRGSGDLGKRWHDEGRMLKKRNTFTDFVRAAELLVQERYTSPEHLAITGGSAGGLLMGAVTNLRPELFRVVLSYVPFVDVLNTMADPSLPLTVGEFEEWGNPQKPEEYAYMRTYSPYENLEAKAYPALLVRTALNDSQVMYWEPAKYVARMRALKTDTYPLVLRINMGAGHGGASGRFDKLREVAHDWAFMLRQLGAPESPVPYAAPATAAPATP